MSEIRQQISQESIGNVSHTRKLFEVGDVRSVRRRCQSGGTTFGHNGAEGHYANGQSVHQNNSAWNGQRAYYQSGGATFEHNGAEGQYANGQSVDNKKVQTRNGQLAHGCWGSMGPNANTQYPLTIEPNAHGHYSKGQNDDRNGQNAYMFHYYGQHANLSGGSNGEPNANVHRAQHGANIEQGRNVNISRTLHKY